jgi:hypothetical protein
MDAPAAQEFGVKVWARVESANRNSTAAANILLGMVRRASFTLWSGSSHGDRFSATSGVNTPQLPHSVELTGAPVLVFRLIVITGRHIRAARALLGLSQHELAKKSKVALRTLSRMEDFDGPISARTETLTRIVVTLEKAGVEFLNDDRPGVRMRGK